MPLPVRCAAARSRCQRNEPNPVQEHGPDPVRARSQPGTGALLDARPLDFLDGVATGVCAAAIETGNLDDPYVEEYVLRIMDEAAQAGKDGRAYVEDRRNKRKR